MAAAFCPGLRRRGPWRDRRARGRIACNMTHRREPAEAPSGDDPHSPIAPLLHFDGGEFDGGSAQAAFRVTHALCGHPLFELERLVRLSKELSPRLVEYNPGSLPVIHDPSTTPANSLSVAETIRRIETCGSWMVLKHVERSPEYGALLDRCVDEVAAAAGLDPAKLIRRAAFLFVSSPGAITPLHLDPENNFLLQIRGEKAMHIARPGNRAVIGERALERFFSGGHRNVLLDEDLHDHLSRFELGPGDGVFVPMPAPHYVHNGDNVSISFSATFHTLETDTTQGVYWINDKLRRLGMRPAPPGVQASADRRKHAIYKSLRAIKRRLPPRR